MKIPAKFKALDRYLERVMPVMAAKFKALDRYQ